MSTRRYVKKSKAPAPKIVYVAAPPVAKRSYTRKSSTAGGLRGHGDYTYDKPGPWGNFGRSVGKQAGAMLGSNYGLGKAGGAIGSKLGGYLHYIGKIFGSGDYVTSSSQVRNNILVNQSQVPQFQDGKNTVRIAHREYLGDIITSSTPGAFSIESYPINPGVSGSFPWLANVVGASFQQYRINGMVFEFRSMSADALTSTNTALGTVAMATDYDSKDTAFTSKQQMENTEFGVSCKPSSCMIHGIECARSQTSVSELYVRAFAVPSGADPRLYDMGNFYIATQGMQGASVNVGELWVSYDITFFKAIEQVPGFIMPLANYTPVTASGTAPLGVTRGISQPRGVDQIGLTFTENRIIFPYNIPIGSTYQWTYTISTASSALTLPVVTYVNGFTDLATYKAPSNGEVATKGLISGMMRLTSPGTPSTPPYVNLADFTVGAISFIALDVAQISGFPAEP
ncbi:putative capsid protein [Chimeric virus 14]|uniref:putative capsid protein n=1 Tax=Chimeric virus 14 TaxID=1608440 RepID=UPI0005B57DF5|nr:putative capsid protein [Chimeric virus 14]AJK30619.1 putative capsid protein [Chimeric virus 14]